MTGSEHSGNNITLAAVGDLMLGDSPTCTGYGFASRYSGSRVGEWVERVRELIRPAEITFGNLECCLSDRGHETRRWTSTQMRGHPAYAAALRTAGFNVLSVANNHASTVKKPLMTRWKSFRELASRFTPTLLMTLRGPGGCTADNRHEFYNEQHD